MKKQYKTPQTEIVNVSLNKTILDDPGLGRWSQGAGGEGGDDYADAKKNIWFDDEDEQESSSNSNSIWNDNNW